MKKPRNIDEKQAGEGRAGMTCSVARDKEKCTCPQPIAGYPPPEIFYIAFDCPIHRHVLKDNK